MTKTTIHNPDRFMVDFRQILTQGRKRIGLLLGAGAPVSIRVNDKNEIVEEGGSLIPDVQGLTSKVIEALNDADKEIIEKLMPDLGKAANIEALLTKIRMLAQAIGSAEIYGLNGEAYSELAKRICEQIGKIVSAELPEGTNPYTELVSWIGGTQRQYPIEIFTPNYDLLLEEAFERAQLPYFDGFSGSHKPFFDSASISGDLLPARWSRLWKIHGSLGWESSDERVIRTGSRKATSLIYPDHLKYDQITRQPFSALFERLREFLTTPDSLLICIGFSFFDAHITAVLDEALSENNHTAVFAFQYKNLDEEESAVKLANRRPNFSVYARDGAVIFGLLGKWQPGQPPSNDWVSIRSTFWKLGNQDTPGEFQLGDFNKLAHFFALAQATSIKSELDNELLQEDIANAEIESSSESEVFGDAKS